MEKRIHLHEWAGAVAVTSLFSLARFHVEVSRAVLVFGGV